MRSPFAKQRASNEEGEVMDRLICEAVEIASETGRLGLGDEFPARVRAEMRYLYTKLHGMPAPDLVILADRRAQLESDWQNARQELDQRRLQYKEDVSTNSVASPVNWRHGLSVVLTLALVGLGLEFHGLAMMWRGWLALALAAALLILNPGAGAETARRVRTSLRFLAVSGSTKWRSSKLRKEGEAIGGQQFELRVRQSLADRFVEERAAVVLAVYQYNLARGRKAAQYAPVPPASSLALPRPVAADSALGANDVPLQ